MSIRHTWPAPTQVAAYAKGYAALIGGTATALLGIFAADTTVGKVLTVVAAVATVVGVVATENGNVAAVVDRDGQTVAGPATPVKDGTPVNVQAQPRVARGSVSPPPETPLS